MKTIIRFLSFGVVIAALSATSGSADEEVRAVVLLSSGIKTVEAGFETDVPVDFIELNGRPMLGYVLDALRGTGKIDALSVCGPAGARERAAKLMREGEKYVTAEGDLVARLERGFPDKKCILVVCPADIPLVTSGDLNELLAAMTAEPEVDMLYPLVSEEDCDKAYPWEERTYARLNGRNYTGGHVQVLRTGRFAERGNDAATIYALRKSPLALIKFMGIGNAFKYLLGRLEAADIEDQLAAKFGIKGRALISTRAGLCTDVSRDADIAPAAAALAGD